MLDSFKKVYVKTIEKIRQIISVNNDVYKIHNNLNG